MHQCFDDSLTEAQRTGLRLFELSAQEYLSAAEEPAARFTAQGPEPEAEIGTSHPQACGEERVRGGYRV